MDILLRVTTVFATHAAGSQDGTILLGAYQMDSMLVPSAADWCATLEPQQRQAALAALRGLFDKWSLPVLGALAKNGTLRFSALERVLPGITQKVLSGTLRALEAQTLVTRTVFPEVPVRVEYQLTGRGSSLLEACMPLFAWRLCQGEGKLVGA
jgi:DNA-binding HxlR family transcriptional regulator